MEPNEWEGEFRLSRGWPKWTMKESGVEVAPRSSRSAPEKKEEPLSVSESIVGKGRRRAWEPSEWHTQFVQLIDIHQRETLAIHSLLGNAQYEQMYF